MCERGKMPPLDQLKKLLDILIKQPPKLPIGHLIICSAGKINDAAHRVYGAYDIFKIIPRQRFLRLRFHMRPLPQFQPVQQRQLACVFFLGSKNVAAHAFKIQRREITFVNPVDVKMIGNGYG